MLLAMVTAFSVIPIQNVFAATGDAAVITFSYTYDSNGNAMHYNSGASSMDILPEAGKV